MRIARVPCPALQPFVARLWYSAAAAAPPGTREHVLPTGAMHLVIRLDDVPLRLCDGGASRSIGTCVVGGPRAAYYVKDMTRPARTVGAMLRAGAALPLFGAPASAFADHHVSLEDVWNTAAHELRDELRAIAEPAAALSHFELRLAERLPRVRSLHPAVAHALARFDTNASVAEVVDETGYSHRRFLSVFRDSVGLAPKAYGRVRRLHRAIAGLTRGDAISAIAAGAGYSDQAHFTRELLELAGVSPTTYRRLDPTDALHVQMASQVQISSRRSTSDEE